MNLMEVTDKTSLGDILNRLFPEQAGFRDYPQEVNGVRFNDIAQSRGFSQWSVIGIKLLSGGVHRRVMVKNGNLDLEAVRVKYEELKPMAEAAKLQREENYKVECARQERLTAFLKAHGIEDNWTVNLSVRLTSDGIFNLSINYLTEKQADKLVRLYQEITKGVSV